MCLWGAGQCPGTSVPETVMWLLLSDLHWSCSVSLGFLVCASLDRNQSLVKGIRWWGERKERLRLAMKATEGKRMDEVAAIIAGVGWKEEKQEEQHG